MGRAGGCPAASYFLLLRQKKVTKEKATRVRRLSGDETAGQLPCAARSVGRLRNSPFGLRQCSPTSPDSSALLSGSHGNEKRRSPTACGDSQWPLCPTTPVRASEQRSGGGGRRASLSERSAAQRVCEARPPTRAAQGSPAPFAGPANPGRLFFGYFLLAKQKKVTCRRATPARRIPNAKT